MDRLFLLSQQAINQANEVRNARFDFRLCQQFFEDLSRLLELPRRSAGKAFQSAGHLFVTCMPSNGSSPPRIGQVRCPLLCRRHPSLRRQVLPECGSARAFFRSETAGPPLRAHVSGAKNPKSTPLPLLLAQLRPEVRFSAQSRGTASGKSPVRESKHTVGCLYRQTIKERTLVARSNPWWQLPVSGRKNVTT